MRDWSKASWVDPALNWTPLPVPELPGRVLMDLATKCNLRCPMCPVWGSEDEAAIDAVTGTMDLEASRRLLDEIMAAKPLIQPNMYGEPLLAPNLRDQIMDMKSRGMAVAMNTNGLTLNENLAQFFVDQKVDSVMFSIDAVSRGTLRKIRGIDKIEKIETAVFRLLKMRGGADFPRVGVSFTIQGIIATKSMHLSRVGSGLWMWSEWEFFSRTERFRTWKPRSSVFRAPQSIILCRSTMTGSSPSAALMASRRRIWGMCLRMGRRRCGKGKSLPRLATIMKPASGIKYRSASRVTAGHNMSLRKKYAMGC